MNLSKKATIGSVKEIAKQTVEVVIKVPEDFTFVAGQYIWLMIPELKYPDPKGNTRMFSIASSPNKKGELDIIFRTSESGYKRTLIEMAPGAEIAFSGPFGPLKLPEDNSRSVVFLAGGVGVTPLLSMIRFSNETKSGHKISLVYANKKEEEAVYVDELSQIEKENPNFKLVKIFGQPETELFKQFLPGKSDIKTSWYVVGPEGFVDFAGKFLRDSGISFTDVVFEEFYPKFLFESESESESEFKKRLDVTRFGKSPFYLAVESSNDHIVITDTNGYILYANKAAEKITGYTFEEMHGSTPRLWGGLMGRDFYKDLWKTIKLDHKKFVGEIKNRRKNQEEYYSITRISPIVDDTGVLAGFVATEEDVTKFKELDNAKSEFISIASHQLRTPISGLSWLTESLSATSKNLTAKQKRYVQDLGGLSRRLTGLIEDLLNFSRIQLGASVMTDKDKVEFKGFVGDFINEMIPYADSKKHTLVFNDNIIEPVTVDINKKSLYNVLQNLMSNAIDYSPANTAVTIKLEKSAKFIKTSISNKGPTIFKEEQVHLFERFYRSETTKKIKPEGTGLGLYIAKAIIDEMGGQIGFEAEKGKDTVFWFTVPLEGVIMDKDKLKY